MDYNHKKLIRRFGTDCFQFVSHGCYGSFEPDKIPLKLEMIHVPSGNSVTVTGFYTADYDKAQRKCFMLMWDVMKHCETKTHLKKLKRDQNKNRLQNKLKKAARYIRFAINELID